MPGGFVFHKRNALAFDGVGDDDGRFVLDIIELIKRGHQLFKIVPVDFKDMPAETRPALGQRFQIFDLVGRSVFLNFIVVHDSTHCSI